ncbi:MAG: hypothetical protein J0L77_02735 [Alphaproteobacteria bacterium]|nr:hypothetical protein [Alphaproteobacteria bacterium]
MSRSWTLLPFFYGRGDRISILPVTVMMAAALCTLSSCSPSSSNSSQKTPTVSSSDDTIAPLAAPPGAESRPPAPGTTGTPKTSDGLPALQPPLGINNTTLFKVPLNDPGERMQRLENAVQELRNDFDKMAPAIVRLVAVESDIQELIKQLQGVVGDDGLSSGMDAPPITEEELSAPIPPSETPLSPPAPPTGTVPALPAETSDIDLSPEANNATPLDSEKLLNAELDQLPPVAPKPSADGAPVSLSPTDAPASVIPPVTAPAPATVTPPPATTPTVAPAPPAQGTQITNLRVGEHADKTRLVFDAGSSSVKIRYTVDLDNGEKILVLELPDSGWSAPATQNFTGAPILVSYKTEKSASGGTLVIFQLKNPAKILYQGQLTGDGKGTRLILDLARL